MYYARNTKNLKNCLLLFEWKDEGVEFIVFDVESTGLDVKKDYIVELGAKKYKIKNKAAECIETLQPSMATPSNCVRCPCPKDACLKTRTRSCCTRSSGERPCSPTNPARLDHRSRWTWALVAPLSQTAATRKGCRITWTRASATSTRRKEVTASARNS